MDKCVLCGDKTTYYCKECAIFICLKCNMTEHHNGVFKCSMCKLMVCNTYRYNETSVCQPCVINNEVTELNRLNPGLGDFTLKSLMDLTDDNSYK